ncbi:MAG TPA: cation:proton antiporter [Gaiellaceae bacterium]
MHSWGGLLHLAFAVAVVSAVAAAGGALARRVGQPRVVGEIAGGIALGPSLLGALAPGAGAALFRPETRHGLAQLATVGVVLFMFAVGLDLDAESRERGRVAVALTHANLLVVAALGVPLALVVFPSFAGAGTSRLAFTAFLSVALAVTALPVLARMLQDSPVAVRPLAGLALTCAALSDAAAWSALIAVVALATAASPLAGARALALAVALAAVALALVRPVALRAMRRASASGRGRSALLVVSLALLACFATATNAIGIHAICGAFLAGFTLRGLRPLLGRGYRSLTAVNDVLLLPVFFAVLGLKMDVRHLASNPRLLLGGLLVLAVAVAGKVGGVAATGRVCGLSWRDAAGLGFLLNTRGLTEAIVLQIGLALGVLTSDGFSVLILVTLITTLMTLPALRAIGLGHAREAPERERLPAVGSAPALAGGESRLAGARRVA